MPTALGQLAEETAARARAILAKRYNDKLHKIKTRARYARTYTFRPLI